MIIDKIINNNIVSSFDDKGKEVVVMGRGLGFQCKPGQKIDETRIEKVFRMENDKEQERFRSVLADISMENIQICSEIIAYAKTVIPNKLSKNIYITLMDHINFAIARQKEGLHFTNALRWEIKKFYHPEYTVGLKAVELVKQRTGIDLSEDEAASIALHFVNAELGTEMPNTIDITKLIQNVLKIITYHFQINIIEDSLNYERFLTHLKFFSQRVVTNRYNHGEEEEFYEIIRKQYPDSYECAGKIKAYVEKEYKVPLPEEEMIYLTIHITRILKDHQGKNGPGTKE